MRSAISPGRYLTTAELTEIAEARRAGYSIAQIADAYSLDIQRAAAVVANVTPRRRIGHRSDFPSNQPDFTSKSSNRSEGSSEGSSNHRVSNGFRAC
jgi:hypothetical protein